MSERDPRHRSRPRPHEQQPRYSEDPIGEPGLPELERDPGTVLSIEDLIGATVVTASGQKVGLVVDVRTTAPPDLRGLGLIVGPGGWLHRLRLADRLSGTAEAAASLREVAWDDVDRWDGLRIVLRGEQKPRRVAASSDDAAANAE